MAVNDDGCFTEKVSDFNGQYVKDADKEIIVAVKVRMTSFLGTMIFINYPSPLTLDHSSCGFGLN